MSTSEQSHDEHSAAWLEEEVARLRADRKGAVDEADRYWSEILYLRKMVGEANRIIRAAAPPEMKSMSWEEIHFALMNKGKSEEG